MTKILSYTHHLKGKVPSIKHSERVRKCDLVVGFWWGFGLNKETLGVLENKWGLMRVLILGVGF